MGRSMADPDYRHRPMPEERKARLSEIHRKRWGAPEGFATVRGVHVPFEHRAPLRYWSDYIAYHDGEDIAAEWLARRAEAEWTDMPELWRLYRARKEIAATRDAIRLAEWELVHGH